MLAVLTVMSNILETSLIRGKMGCDDDDEMTMMTLYLYLLLYLGYGTWLMLISNYLKATN